jgi:hypothetical protein
MSDSLAGMLTEGALIRTPYTSHPAGGQTDWQPGQSLRGCLLFKTRRWSC